MFYALAHFEEEFLADSLHKFVALAPCTLYNVGEAPESYFEESLFAYPSVGVYNMYGPNWEANYAKVCEELGDAACELGACTECEPVSVHSETHWMQNAFTGRF